MTTQPERAISKKMYWRRTGGDNPLRGYNDVGDAIIHGRRTPLDGRLPYRSPLTVACIDSGVINDGTLIRTAAGAAFSPEAQGVLSDIKDYLAAIGYHPDCGRTKIAVAEHGVDAGHVIDAVAEHGARRIGERFGLEVVQHELARPRGHQLARLVVIDATADGFDPSLIKDSDGKQLLPPALVINGGICGPNIARNDSKTATRLVHSSEGFGDLFAETTPLYLAVIWDSKKPNGRLNPDEALSIAHEIHAMFPDTTEVHPVDLSQRPSTRRVLH